MTDGTEEGGADPAAPPPGTGPAAWGWVNAGLLGIVLATFFSDVSHEMCTAVLPLYLSTIGLGPAALGVVEGVADLLVCLAKLGGGLVGHRLERKKPWTAGAYLVTALATAAISAAGSLVMVASLRSLAWIARGFRSPLRDFLLADAVEPTHYGRAYGLERAGDMLGAAVGPLLAALFLYLGVDFRLVIAVTIVPGVLAAASIFFLARERVEPVAKPSTEAVSALPQEPTLPRPAARLPASFRWFLVGVFFFGMGDFSRTFLILLAGRALAVEGTSAGPAAMAGTLSWAVLLYALHNVVSALAALPWGVWGDRASKRKVLVWGYALGAGTNLLLAWVGGSFLGLAAAMLLSGVYLAAEETLEKAAAAEMLPRESRSYGFGILAAVNAVGDMASSLYVGFLLEAGAPGWAFGLAAAFGLVGTLWTGWLAFGRSEKPPALQAP